jgi:hypothetical protein
MRTALLFKSILLVLIALAGCQKEDVKDEIVEKPLATTPTPVDINQLYGSYNVDFSAIYYFNVGFGYSKVNTGTTTLTISAPNTYSCVGLKSRFPAGGKGTFSVKNDTVYFSNELIFTCEFDHGLILQGAYAYRNNGDTQRLIKESDNVRYEYILTKTN